MYIILLQNYDFFNTFLFAFKLHYLLLFLFTEFFIWVSLSKSVVFMEICVRAKICQGSELESQLNFYCKCFSQIIFFPLLLGATYSASLLNNTTLLFFSLPWKSILWKFRKYSNLKASCFHISCTISIFMYFMIIGTLLYTTCKICSFFNFSIRPILWSWIFKTYRDNSMWLSDLVAMAKCLRIAW